MYDLIIIGAGPAGMSAAIYAARRKVKFLIISENVGGQMTVSTEIDNYPGVPDQTGTELVNRFKEHLKDYNIEVKAEKILKLWKVKNLCVVKTSKNIYNTKAVIVTTGKKARKLGVPGEKEFEKKGISYCANCDAPLFKDKIVCVVGGGNSGLEAAYFLTKYAKKVYILNLKSKLTGEQYLIDKLINEKKVKIITNAKTTEIKGDDFVREIIFEKEGVKKKLKVEGVFIEIGLVTEADYTNVQKNKWNEIMIFRSTISHKENLTSVKGIFAAGDVTDIPSKQIVVAAGEGCKAVLASFDYIDRWSAKNKTKTSNDKFWGKGE